MEPMDEMGETALSTHLARRHSSFNYFRNNSITGTADTRPWNRQAQRQCVLCHRVDGGLVFGALHEPDLGRVVEQLRGISTLPANPSR